MELPKVTSIFTVTDYKTGKSVEEFVPGHGQEAIRKLKKKYPRFTKYVLEGFQVRDKFVHAQIF